MRSTDLAGAFELTFDLTDAPRFPLVRVGIATAVVTVASPYLARPTRRVGQGLVLALALAAMYLGRAMPTDVVAAIVLGWGAAAAVHFAFGTPARRPTVAQVHTALDRARDPVDRAARRPTQQPVGRAMFVAQGADGPLRVVALGRDEADAQFLARMWRWIAYRDAAPTLFPTRRRQIEYEADVMRRAADGGARVPAVRWAGQQGSLALLVVDEVVGTPLRDVDPATDAWPRCSPTHGGRRGRSTGPGSPTGASTATTSWSTARRSLWSVGSGRPGPRASASARTTSRSCWPPAQRRPAPTWRSRSRSRTSTTTSSRTRCRCCNRAHWRG